MDEDYARDLAEVRQIAGELAVGQLQALAAMARALKRGHVARVEIIAPPKDTPP